MTRPGIEPRSPGPLVTKIVGWICVMSILVKLFDAEFTLFLKPSYSFLYLFVTTIMVIIMRSPNIGQTTRHSDSWQKKRTWWTVDFAILADYKLKIKESKKRDKSLDLTGELKKLWNMKVTVIPIVIGAPRTIPKRLVKGMGRLGKKRKGRDHPDHPGIIKIAQSIEKSPGNLRRLAVTQTPVRNHQLMLTWKTLKGVNNNNNKRPEIIQTRQGSTE